MLLLLFFQELIECNLQPLTSFKVRLSAIFSVLTEGHVLPPDQSKTCFGPTVDPVLLDHL